MTTNGHFGKRGLKYIPALLAAHPETVISVADTQDIPAGGLYLLISARLGRDDINADDLRLPRRDARREMAGWTKKDHKDENNHSVVLLVHLGDTKTNMGLVSLKSKLGRNRGLLADIYLDPLRHHGYAYGTLPECAEYICPRVAVLSRDADDAGYESTIKEWNQIVREKRSPTSIHMWARAHRGVDDLDVDEQDSLSDGNAVPNKRNHERIPAEVVLSGEVYLTGMDGIIFVDLTPDGDLTAEIVPCG